MNIKVVADSTSDLPTDIVSELGITVIPQKVIFGTQEMREGVDIQADEYYRRVESMDTLPTTSQASVGEFIELYESIGQDADAIVSVHVSSLLSGTVNSATRAAEQADVDCPIHVVDSLTASMGAGLIAMEAAREAQRGSNLQQVLKRANQASERSEVFVLLDTLENLVKGGRIGKARAMIGSLLQIKPMIIVQEGVVNELGKERTHRKGKAKLLSVARDYAPLDEVFVMHTTTPEEASEFAKEFQSLLPSGKTPQIAQIGPAVGTYTGRSALGVALLRADD